MTFQRTVSFIAFDNDFGTDDRAWVPEIWATETLAILEENMVIGNLVYRDFSDEIQNFGDLVHTRKPGEFVAQRKGKNDDVVIQPATAEQIQVPLDQHFHTSFLIRDGEESKSFKSLVEEYLNPAALSLAQAIDKALLGQTYRFLNNQSQVTGDIKAAMLDVRQKQNELKVPVNGRNLILTTSTETEALALDLFLSAERVGDDGTALRDASLGKKLGYQTFMSQNASGILSATGTTGTSGAAGSTDGIAAAGATTITMTTDSSVILPGMYVTFDNSGGVYRVVSSTATSLVIDRGLLVEMADDSLATWYTQGGVDLAGDSGATAYPLKYGKKINIDAGGVVPQVGQLVAFSTTGDVVRAGQYSIIDVSDGSGAGDYYIMLDRPLEEALADNDKVNYGPDREFNLAFDEWAIALVMRPLAQPKPGTGALSGVSSFNNLSMRVVITYQGVGQGHLVTIDMLAGLQVLDEDRGAVMIRA